MESGKDHNDDMASQPADLEVSNTVKAESCEPEEHDLNAIPATGRTDASIAIDMHGLPELGNTDVPDDLGGQDRTQEAAMSSDQLADILTALSDNNADGHVPHSPQPEIDSGEEDTAARNGFEKAKAIFHELQRTLRATTADEIDFKRIENEEEGRIRARKQRKEHENHAATTEIEENSLFIPEKSPSPPLSAETMLDLPPEVTATPKKPRQGRPKGIGDNSFRRGRQTKSGAVKKRQNRRAPKIDINDLMHHDIIAAATANQGKAPQPGFSAKNKKEALSQLISSLPADERSIYAGDKADLSRATRSFNGRAALRANGDGTWRLRGMKTSMHHYQLLGVSWMRERENSKTNPRGGILSDEMGMGKTVSALTNMVDGKPLDSYRGPRATLVVVPSSLMSQWMCEIEKHVEAKTFPRVMIYRSSLKAIDLAAFLGSQDVVITSYHEVAKSLPKNNPPPSIYTSEAKAEWWAHEVNDKKGPLHEVYWYRIVLDEAQAIKNYLSKTSDAVCRLQGRYRWCMSGTPIQNSLEEFYPYFRFLRYNNTGDFDLFKRNFTKHGSHMAVSRLQVILDNFMLRRTHKSELFGRPILQLPPIKPVETIEVEFNVVERALYNIVVQNFTKNIQALYKKGKHENNYQQTFVLLLRLRQLVSHPLLTQKTLKDLLEFEDLERLDRLTHAALHSFSSDVAEQDGADTAQALRVAVSEAIKSRKSGLKKGAQIDNELSKGFRKYLKALRDGGQWAEANARAMCCACNSPPTNALITPCNHLYCRACFNELQYFKSAQDAEQKLVCVECSTIISHNETFVATTSNEPGPHGGNNQTPEEDIDWYTLPGPMLRSAKIKGAVAKIKEWFQQDPSNKIIVFTQFRGLIKIMERVCQEEGDWGYAIFSGEMTFDSRDEQVRKFSTEEGCRILLAALKAGGVGLNLTAANRVIILDLWWNASVESQAFTRCFRIGQKRDVEVVRFVVRNSIDTDIVRMQERKTADIKLAMDEGNRKNFSTKELLELFHYANLGTNRDDGDGDGGNEDQGAVHGGPDEPFVFPEDPHDPSRKPDSDIEIIGVD